MRSTPNSLRGHDQRIALVPLLWHRNIQVRLNAAIDSLAIAPVEARAVLQQFRESRQGPQCLQAGMMIRGLDDGSYIPS
jgi:hypothetical protein